MLSILIADDSPDSRILLKAFLKRPEHAIAEVENGKEAEELAKKNHYDVIFMDIQMPVQDGLAAARAIRNWERSLHHTPTFIVALTGSESPDEIDRCLSAGCDLHIAKPVSRKTLLQLITEISERNGKVKP